MDMNADAKKSTTFDVERIMDLIPHRYPFLMIDRMIDVVPGKSAVGIKNVSINEPFFQGHFPSKPIMPGVLIVEAMAQTAGALVIYTNGQNSENTFVYFMSVEQARFRKPITPGDCIHLHVEKQQSRGDVWKFKGEAMVDGVLMAEAVYTAMIVEKDK
ncbi:MAG TPA: 3-hydroxyacyl-ACP dehydratase FabZ [Rhodospirillales bacterium]|nr:3-hydroxyacyl-ACP dehydratase FabZ [Rhodospirillales bacterium]